MSTLRYSNPFLTNLKHSVQDGLEQIYRKCRRVVKPFRYWNFLSLLRMAHAGLHIQGYFLFSATNRLLGSRYLSLRNIIWLRRRPNNLQEASVQLSWFWYTYCFGLVGAGFPFYVVQHPTSIATAGLFYQRIHPVLYWGFFSVYKIVWSSLQAVTVANWLTDPYQHNTTTRYGYPCRYTSRLLKKYNWLQRERILRLENLRYQDQLPAIHTQLRDPQNQATIRALRIENRWVALGTTGSAIQDVVDEAREMVPLRPVQVVQCFRDFGRSLPLLDEVCISMSLSLPLSAIGQLLEVAPLLKYLKLDGVALSVHDLQNDLLEFGARLHGVRYRGIGGPGGYERVRLLDRAERGLSTNSSNSDSSNDTAITHQQQPQGQSSSPSSSSSSRRRQRPPMLRLETLILEHCRLESDDADPQMRTRYCMDLLLTPALLVALVPPTCLSLQHLTLHVKCQRISVLELAVTLSANTSLQSLDLHLLRDTSVEIPEELDASEEADDWIILPLAQTLQYSNRTLQTLQLQLSTGLVDGGISEAALIQMMEANESLKSLEMWQCDTQHRIRIPELDFYLHLNQLNRLEYRLDRVGRPQWVEMLIAERRNVAVVFHMLSLNPSPILLHDPRARYYHHRLIDLD